MPSPDKAEEALANRKMPAVAKAAAVVRNRIYAEAVDDVATVRPIIEREVLEAVARPLVDLLKVIEGDYSKIVTVQQATTLEFRGSDIAAAREKLEAALAQQDTGSEGEGR